MKYSLEQLRQVPGIGEKTIQRIVEQFSKPKQSYDTNNFEINESGIYLGDCLEVMDGLISKGVKVDAVITDPPYGVTRCKWDSVIPFEELWKRLKSIRKDHAPVVLFGSEPFSSYLRISNLTEYKYDWIWKKEAGVGFLNAKKCPCEIRKT